MSFTDPLTADLPRCIRRSGHYSLRRSGDIYAVWLDYTDDENDVGDGGGKVKRSMFMGDLVHAENFESAVDDLEEEARYLAAEFF